MKRISFSLFFLSLLLSTGSVSAQQAQVIAHRGYWTVDGSAQNSISSLQHADSVEVYGSEFDVHLTADDIPVVFHDSKVNEMTIQEVPFSDLQSVVLTNGESIPTLQEYLDAAQGLNTRLIFELKSHKTPERDREAARKVVDMIDAAGLTGRTEYIAFSLEAAKALHRYSPQTPVYYLNGDLDPQAVKALGFAGIDYNYKVMQKNPDWFKQAKELGLKVNVWTVNDPAVMQEMIESGADFITTDYPEAAKKAVLLHSSK